MTKPQTKTGRRLLLVLLGGCWFTLAQAQETLGRLNLSYLLLRPDYRSVESGASGFSLGDSSLGFDWRLDESVGAKASLGAKRLLYRPSRLNPDENKDEFAVIEGYAFIKGIYGELRAGLLPLDLGVEGRLTESNRIFARSSYYAEGYGRLRDFGLDYRIDNNGFFVQMGVHNGEAEQPSDGRLWYASQAGYRFENGGLGVAGITGSYAATQTRLGESLAGTDPTIGSRWREGILFFWLESGPWSMSSDLHAGEAEQSGSVKKRFVAGHLDNLYRFSQGSLFGSMVGLRLEQWDPNTGQFDDERKSASLLLGWNNKTQTQSVFIVGRKVLEEKNQIPNDEVLVEWRLSSLPGVSLF